MKIIRKSVFETNSSSAHSLVISKEKVKINENEEIYNISDKYFGPTFELYSVIGGSDWRDTDEAEEERYKKDLKKNKWSTSKYDGMEQSYGFDFCRGKPRVYSDFIHKTAFILSVNSYKEDKDLDGFLNMVTKKAKEYLEKVNNDYYVKPLIEKFLEKDFRDKRFLEYAMTSECSNYSNILSEILTNEDLIDNFIFNNKSYIALGGDEYEGSYLKLVGTTYEYYNLYGANRYEEEFEKRKNEIYPEDRYLVEYDL